MLRWPGPERLCDGWQEAQPSVVEAVLAFVRAACGWHGVLFCLLGGCICVMLHMHQLMEMVMLDDVLRDQARISNDVSELDYFPANLSRMIVESNESDVDFNQAIQFSKGADDSLDIKIQAHHRKFLLKYSHVIQVKEGQPELFGEYRLLEIDENQSAACKFKSGDLFSFLIDQDGDAIVNGKTIICAPNSPYEREQRRAVKKAILFAIHKTMVPAQ